MWTLITWTTLASAIPVQDDFEAGALNPPWILAGVGADAGVAVTVSDAGAHRGNFGLRVDDQQQGIGLGSSGYVLQNVSGFTDAIYLRYWSRWDLAGGGPGTNFEIDFLGLSPGPYDAGSAGTIVVVGGPLLLAGFDHTDVFVQTAADAGFPANEWHLVELGVTGIGTTDGGRFLWFDGQLVGQQPGGHDLGTLAPSLLAVGEQHGPLALVGTMDFDDVRASTAPNATWLVITGPTAANAGDCVPLQLLMVDSESHAFAPAPYAVVASMTSTPGGVFSNSSSCAPASSSLQVAPGTASITGYFTAQDAGVYVLAAAHPDFLSGPALTIVIQADAGMNRTASAKYSVGCACDGTGAPVELFLCSLALFAVLGKRARLVSDRTGPARG